MKKNGTIFTITGNEVVPCEQPGQAEPLHMGNIYDTPLREDAFEVSNEKKISIIERHFTEIMKALGLDLEDDSLKETPRRVATMFVQEIFSGLDPANQPMLTLFENKYRYNHMLVEKNIEVQSTCEHHFVPIVGKAHIAYIPAAKVIGLSKLNRLVHYYSKRPQVQERLTIQVANAVKSILQTEDVAVVIDAVHLCVTSRGVRDADSSTVTSHFSGRFKQEDTRDQFLAMIK